VSVAAKGAVQHVSGCLAISAPAVARGTRPADVAYLFGLEGGWTDIRGIVAVPDRYLRP
jgi:hypothetical protein